MQQRLTTNPHIFDVNLGERLDQDAVDMPRTNADSLPVFELTEEQKYTFYTLGFLVVSAVLAKDDLEETRDSCCRLQRDAASIPEPHRSPDWQGDFSPHQCNSFFRLPGDSKTYRGFHSGLTRVVWELNPVAKGEGARS